jgi:diguanylate cyclase (GGDEF)-like protein
VRETDTVARLGGDEFAVILPAISRREEAERIAAKIGAALAARFHLVGGAQRVNIGSSIGIALFPADAGDADALVMVADVAMFKEKRPARAVIEPGAPPADEARGTEARARAPSQCAAATGERPGSQDLP